MRAKEKRNRFIRKSKTAKRITAWGLSMAMVLGMSYFPGNVKEAKAAVGVTAPSVEKYATVSDLKSADNFTLDTRNGSGIGQKVAFGGDTWYIVGAQDNDLVIIANPGNTELKSNAFRENSSTGNNYEYDGETCDVFPNHYGISTVREFMKSTLLSKFTTQEQAVMKGATVYTWDASNKKVYTTSDKLYIPYGEYFPDNDEDDHITVGNTSGLNTGIKVALTEEHVTANSPFANGLNTPFWLRTPGLTPGFALYAAPGGTTDQAEIDNDSYNILPVFHLDLTAVLFASTVSVVSNSPTVTNTMNFRFQDKDNNQISSSAVYDSNAIKVTKGTGSGEYLYVQYKLGSSEKVWSKEITQDFNVYKDCISNVNSFSNCKIWIEKKDSSANMVYASMAEAGSTGITKHFESDPDNENQHKCLVCGAEGTHDFIVNGENDNSIATCSICGGDNPHYSSLDGSISVPQTSISKTYGDDAFSLGATKTGDGTLTYAVTTGDDVVSVDDEGMVSVIGDGTATITISMAATDNYKAAEDVVVTVTVAKADLVENTDYTIPTDLEAQCKDALSSVTLPSGFAWKNQSQTLEAGLDEAGETVNCQATVTKEHYNDKDIAVPVKVSHDLETVQITENVGNEKHTSKCKACEQTFAETDCYGGEATCTQKAICEICNKPYGSLAAHRTSDAAMENEIPATCETAGQYDEVITCLECEKELSRETKPIVAKGHNWDKDFTIDKEATIETTGVKSIHCGVCGKIKEGSEVEIPKVTPETTPTVKPTTEPTAKPTLEPTQDPNTDISPEPSLDPNGDATPEPTLVPSGKPTAMPTLKPAAKPAKAKIASAKNRKKRKLIIKIKKTQNATGYQVQYAKTKKFKKAKTKTVKSLKVILKKLKKKTYYIRVRGVNGKEKGAWSKVKKVKIKK